jgi:Fe-S oxidoreductase
LLTGHISSLNRLGSIAPSLYNFVLSNRLTSTLLKWSIGFASGRSIPLINRVTFKRWLKQNLTQLNPENPKGSLCLFIDEFTNYNDAEIGIAAIRLLTTLNYRVVLADHYVSARTFISKGMLRKAQKVIRGNIRVLSAVISNELPLVGIEPSAILGFRDEYPELAGDDLKLAAESIACNSFLFEEFIIREFRSGRIDRNMFTEEKAEILLHAHCQQKAIASSSSTLEMLSVPVNYNASEIPSGCCGMAGSFGYEREHFELSNKVGELVLFPEIRKMDPKSILAAPGTSCRHHIKDGTGRVALHPAVILFNALRK